MQAAEIKGPVYIRMPRHAFPIFCRRNREIIKNGSAEIRVRREKTTRFLRAGTMVKEAQTHRRSFEGRESDLTVVDVTTVKPLDKDMVKKIHGESKAIFTVEEHSISAAGEPPSPKWSRR
jgi:transketolase